MALIETVALIALIWFFAEMKMVWVSWLLIAVLLAVWLNAFLGGGIKFSKAAAKEIKTMSKDDIKAIGESAGQHPSKEHLLEVAGKALHKTANAGLAKEKKFSWENIPRACDNLWKNLMKLFK